MSRRAFTLIELLVVIAIIAILAAILFPVFAQAKSAAKDSVALSNVKQLGLGVIMYTNDSDDAFPPVTTITPPGNFTTWQFTTQPYLKNYGILLHPKLPNPPNSSTNFNQWFFQTAAHFGMPPRGVANSQYQAPNGTNPGNYYFKSTSQTGGEIRLIDGIGGQAVDPSVGWANQVNAPSLTTTSIGSPSDQVMITEAGNWDLQWGFVPGTPMNYSFPNGLWADTTLDVVQGTDYCGPHARKNPKSFSGYGTLPASGLPYPDGFTTYVATDGSAHSSDWKGRIVGDRLVLSSGLVAMKHMWPQGQ